MSDSHDLEEAVERDDEDIRLPGSGPRRLRLYFYTSNVAKFLQARHVLSRYGYVVEHFQRTTAYAEEYSKGKDDLLATAIAEVRAAVGRNVLFFVEDTSLRIEALSDDEDVPGLAVKEWLTSATFQGLDDLLRDVSPDRRATIKSGIALYLPGRGRPVYFYGETKGMVADTPPSFVASRLYPWLSASTFDGWFVPDGSTKRLGEMDPDESLRLHFRALSLRRLAERMAEYSAVVNLPQEAYFVRRQTASESQLPLFPERNGRYVVVGERAAGKTTFGEAAAGFLGVEHREASMIVRLYHDEISPSEPDMGKFALALHAGRGEDLVVRTLMDQYGLADAPRFVVTGLRKFAELLHLARHGVDYKLVYVEASARTRYDRYVRRARDSDVKTFDQFVAESEGDAAFLKFARESADVIIRNEYDLDHYLRQVEYAVGHLRSRPQGLGFRKGNPDGMLVVRIARVLAASTSALTAAEVTRTLGEHGESASTSTVSRTLRESPGMFEVVTRRGTSSYRPRGAVGDMLDLARERSHPEQ